MGEQHPLGTMADPRELLRALKALGLIELPTPPIRLAPNRFRVGERCGGWSVRTISRARPRPRC